jgi:hypothetical protein
LALKNARIHDPVFADDRFEVHVRQNIPIDVDAGRHLDQRQAAPHPPEDAAFGDVVDRLATIVGVLAIEGDLFDLLEELSLLTLLNDAQFAVLDLDFETLAGEGADEDHQAGVLADVDEAAGAGQAAAKAADVDVASGVALGHAETGHIEARHRRRNRTAGSRRSPHPC